MTLASSFYLEDLIGKKVKATREFSGVPVGMTGTVAQVYDIGSNHRGIDVDWDKPMAAWSDKKLRGGFGRDKQFDETQWLEVVEA